VVEQEKRKGKGGKGGERRGYQLLLLLRCTCRTVSGNLELAFQNRGKKKRGEKRRVKKEK